MLNLSHKMMQTTSITVGRKEIWILYTRWQESYVIKRAEAQTNTPLFMRSNKIRCIKGPSCSVSYPPRKSLTYSWEMRIRHKQSVDYPSQRHLSTFPRLNPENPSVEGSCCPFIEPNFHEYLPTVAKPMLWFARPTKQSFGQICFSRLLKDVALTSRILLLWKPGLP